MSKKITKAGGRKKGAPISALPRARESKSIIKQRLSDMCDLIACGVPIRRLREHGYPDETNIYMAKRRDPEIAAAIEAAQAAAQDYEADQCVAIADAATTPEEAQVAKLQIWARQWRAAKLAPKKYGDKIQHSGDASAPLTVQVVRITDARPLPGIDATPSEVTRDDDTAT